MHPDVLEAIKRSAAVPSMPQVVVRFLEVIQDPAFEYDDLARILSTDAGTAAEILRLANSALFGVRNKITSLYQALTLLGPKRTRSLVLGRYIVETMGRASVESLDMSYFWRRSLVTSVLASHLARSRLSRLREDVFIAALLSDIGIPILAQAIPDRYAAVTERYTPHGEPITDVFEREAAGVTHAEVSTMVLIYWSLPEQVARAVRLHQAPPPADGQEATAMARLLHGCERISKLLCEVPEPDEIATTCLEALTFVDADPATLLDLLEHVERDVEELAELLRIDVIPSSIYELIAQSIRDQLEAAEVN